MGTIIRRNERSWAIVIISEIKVMLNGLGLKIKSAGGESTLSVHKKSMFPDVLLYEDEAQTKILQGWELKMPDVLITDHELIADATRKAKALGLNSFVIWNFTYGKLLKLPIPKMGFTPCHENKSRSKVTHTLEVWEVINS